MQNSRLLAFTRYSRLGASSRVRFFQYIAILNSEGISVDFSTLFDDEMLWSRYTYNKYKKLSLLLAYLKRLFRLLTIPNRSVFWIEKELFPWLPYPFEWFFLRNKNYILDYDDAIFHQYDAHRNSLVRFFLAHKLDSLMRYSSLVICGNQYLADRARGAGAKFVAVIPTVIQLSKYSYGAVSHVCSADNRCRIVWIGSPSTISYLNLISEPLKILSSRVPFTLRVIGAVFDIPGVSVECIPWSEEAEVAAISECNIGVMPLVDSAWERGKCGYKLIQYMACGLPVVASPVGVNVSIVEQGVTGFLAASSQDWIDYLEKLVSQPFLRERMGRDGQVSVEHNYCLEVAGPKLKKLFDFVLQRCN